MTSEFATWIEIATSWEPIAIGVALGIGAGFLFGGIIGLVRRRQ